jgi:uncharacterized membrane protein YoaK (UPF0700 family)
MFRHEGPSRSPRSNAKLAGYLAFNAGFVNSGGFILIGSFTSHVTGSVGRLSNDLATGDAPAALSAAFLVIAFFCGAVASSLILDGGAAIAPGRAYSAALLVEAALLLAFMIFAGLNLTAGARALDAEASLLSAAMGMQNALVTRVSGAVVRTTHLTGVVTDLGIETARWFWWRRAAAGTPNSSKTERPANKPSPERVGLLLTIVAAFAAGAATGATLTLRMSRWSMIVPVIATLLASVLAYRSAKSGPGP